MKRRPYLTAALLPLCWGASLALWAGWPSAEVAARQWHAVTRGDLFGGRFWLYVGWSVVLHTGWRHLLLNSLALAVCGGGLERLWGSPYFCILVLLSGVSGSAAQAAWWGHGDIGISGVVYACVGALLATQARGSHALPKYLRAAVAVLMAWLVVGVVRGAAGVPGIGNVSHLVGFVIGAAYALAKERLGAPAARSSEAS